MNSTNNGSTHDLVSRNCLIALAALSGANVIAHLIALPSLPAQIPTHWGASGEVNDWGPSWTAAALGALPLGMLALLYVIPRIDPKGNGYARAGKFYQRFVVGVTLLMIAISWLPELTVWGVIAAKGSTNVIVSVLIGALFVGIGVGLSVRAGGAPGGDDALAMTLHEVLHQPIERIYLASDLIVLALSATYLPMNRLACSLLTVILSGQLIGLIQRIPSPLAQKGEELSD